MPGPRVAVRIERAGDDRYTVDVTVHRGKTVTPAGSGSFAEADLPRLPPIAVDGPQATKIKLAEAGVELYDLLAKTGLEPTWTELGKPALLLDIRDDDLAQKPWELLRDPTTRRPFLQKSAPAARARLPFDPNRPPPGVPIRLLVLVDSPTDDELAQVDEIEAIFAGLAGVPCGWQVEILRGPEEDAFHELYETFAPDVLHMIGHATPSWAGRAMVVQPPSGEWHLTAEYLVTTLPPENMPRLVVLNACRTAEHSNEAVRYARGLVDALLDGGVCAVVAMQGDVAFEPAATFAGALYQRLADQKPLDVAVAEARAAVATTTRFEARDWALPVLEVRTDPARVLDQRLAADAAALIRRHHGFEMVRRMVDRADVRRRFHDGQARPKARGGPGGLMFVTGEHEVGKTILTRSCVVSHVLGGVPVVYHSLDGPRTISTADFLLGIVDAARRWLGDDGSKAALDAAQACADTDCALRRLFGMPVPGGAPATGALIDVLGPVTMLSRPGAAGGPATEGYSRVLDLLARLGTPRRPVVLVLDHLGNVEEKSALVGGLLLPASQDKLRNVRVVVVEQRQRLNGIAGPELDVPIPDEREVRVTDFLRAHAGALVREYLARSRRNDGGDIEKDRWTAMRAELIAWATAEMADTRVALMGACELASAVDQRMRKHQVDPWGAG